MESKIWSGTAFKKAVSIIGAYIIAILLFVTTGGALPVDTSLPVFSEERFGWWLFSFTMIAGLVLYLLNYNKKLVMNDNVKKKVILFFICCVTYLYKFQGDFEWYLGFFVLLIIWLMLFLYQADDPAIVWQAFVNVAVLYAVISLVFYFGGTCMHLIPESGRTSLTWGTWTEDIRTFHNIYYESQFLEITDSVSIPRNCGIFPEGPMYSFVLCIAIASELFLTKCTHWWKVVLLTFTALTTFSTSTYLFLIAAVILYFANIVFAKKERSVYKKALIILTLLGGFVMAGLMIQKLTTTSGSGSMSVRTDHLLACLKAWADSPIIGVGFQNVSNVLQYAQHKQGISMGLPFLAATGGLLMLSLLVVPFVFNAIPCLKHRRYDELIFETLFLILYVPTPITVYPVFKFYIAYIIIFDFKADSLREDPLKNKINIFLEKRQDSVSLKKASEKEK